MAGPLLLAITSQPSHSFWPDDVSYLALPQTRIARGHKQITGNCLVAQAGKYGRKLATLDDALEVTFPDVCELI